MLQCTLCSIYKNIPNILNSNTLVLLTNFLYTVSSFIWGRFLCKNCSLHIFISSHFRSIRGSFSSSLHKGYLPPSSPFLRPISFQIHSLNNAIAFLSLTLWQDVYNSLPHFFLSPIFSLLLSVSLYPYICLQSLTYYCYIAIISILPDVSSQILFKVPSLNQLLNFAI